MQFLGFLNKKCEASEKCLKTLLELERQARLLAKQLRITHRRPETDRDLLENIRKVVEELIAEVNFLSITSPVLQEKLLTSLNILRRLDCNDGAVDYPCFIATGFLILWGFEGENPVTFPTIEAAKQFLNSSIKRRIWMRVTRQSYFNQKL